MASGSDKTTSAEGIRMRALQLAASGEQHTAEAETLAAVAEGTLTFEQVDDGTLSRCIEAFGSSFVADAFTRARGVTEPAPESGRQREGLEPVMRTSVGKSTVGGAWWNSRLGWLAAAAVVVVVVGVVAYRATRPPIATPAFTVADTALSIQWPAQAPFDPSALKRWGAPGRSLPKDLPDFAKGPSTLGATGTDRYAPWRLATVIVRSEEGWGSGALISADGWLLTNYHVVAGAAQKAAVEGRPAVLDVITAQIVEGHARPQPALKATVYRADPVHDLALLKLDALPVGRGQMSFFPLGTQVRDGEDCFVIGSQHNGPAWWIRSGTVSQQFDYPDELSQFAAGAASTATEIDRDRATVIVTDARVSPGDSGGPLLNAKGELIGLTFATSANASAGSVGWHIALPHLRNFVANLPSHPEGVPFDPWTAGEPHATSLEPQLADGDHDGHPDSLVYRFSREGDDGAAHPVALTLFVDFRQRASGGHQPLDLVPAGLWGMEKRGRFRFDLFLTARADGVTAAGYPNSEGVIDEIRIGQGRQDAASVVWRRDGNGEWHGTRLPTPVPLVDTARIGRENIPRLNAIAAPIMATPGEPRRNDRTSPQPRGGADSGEPNVIK